MPDNRTAARKCTFLIAYATLGTGRGQQPCLVRDLSRTGARIVMAGADRAPARFDLHINGRDSIFRVETVWQTGTEVGVRVLDKRPIETCEIGDPQRRNAV